MREKAGGLGYLGISPGRRPFGSGSCRRFGVEHSFEDTFMADTPLVGVVMGSTSDWETMKHVCEALEQFGVPYEKRVTSAHRTPDLTAEYARTARARGLKVIVAGAGGAAHLAGVVAAHTTLPVLGVPMQSSALNGLDSLLSTVQMPGGIPVGTLAIGKAGATNAGLLAVAILATHRADLAERLEAFRAAQSAKVAEARLP
jgi:5-(carboxyamino)imidazole ribonucleotide mutase